jgi:hypothetical protein
MDRKVQQMMLQISRMPNIITEDKTKPKSPESPKMNELGIE